MTSRDIADAEHPLSKFKGWWAGDVWKMIPTLKKYRPDLELTLIDCVPTGLVLVRGLDPANNVLQRNYEEIVKSFQIMDRGEFDAYWASVEITAADDMAESLAISQS